MTEGINRTNSVRFQKTTPAKKVRKIVVSDTFLVKCVQIRNAVVGTIGGLILIPITLALSIPSLLCDLAISLFSSRNKEEMPSLVRLEFGLILAMFSRANVRKDSLQHNKSHIINTLYDLPIQYRSGAFGTILSILEADFFLTDSQVPYRPIHKEIPISRESALKLGFKPTSDEKQTETKFFLCPIYFHGVHDTASTTNSMLISADLEPKIISKYEKVLLDLKTKIEEKEKTDENVKFIPLLIGHSQGGAIVNLLAAKHNLLSATFNAQPVNDKLGEKFAGKIAWNTAKTDPSHTNFVEQGDWVADMKTSWLSAPQRIGTTYIFPAPKIPGNRHSEVFTDLCNFLRGEYRS